MIDQTISFRNGEKTKRHSHANPPIKATRTRVSHKGVNGRRSDSVSGVVEFINPRYVLGGSSSHRDIDRLSDQCRESIDGHLTATLSKMTVMRLGSVECEDVRV